MNTPLPPPIRIQVGPANAFSHPGALDRLGEFFSDAELADAHWIGGARALVAEKTLLSHESIDALPFPVTAAALKDALRA
jgi:hypothetical protein